MIYQHATRDRDQAIAKALGTFVREARATKEEPPEAPERDEQGRMTQQPVWHVCGTTRKNNRVHHAIEHRKMTVTSKDKREWVTGIEPA